MHEERLAGLTVRVCDGPGRAASGAGVILLHGFGAPGNDLVPLAEVLPVPQGTRFLFPAAPVSIPTGFRESLGWWMLDLERRRDLTVAGAPDIAHEVPLGLREARERVVACLREAVAQYGLDPRRTVLGGFSQGAMLACDVALRTEAPLAGLVLLSGALIAQAEWQPLMPKRRGLRVFMSHGHRDEILPVTGAKRLRDLLSAAGLAVEWLEFPGDHEIPPAVLLRLGAFLEETLGS